MKQKVFLMLALLLMAVMGATAQSTYTVQFKANNNTKTVENVTLPHTFQCNLNTGNGELDQIIKELYGSSSGFCCGNMNSSGNENVTCGTSGTDDYITISAPFEGTATVIGNYYFGGAGDEVYTLEISIPDYGKVNVTGVSLSETTASMTVGGETLTLTATVAPDNATDKTVTWTTSDASVATVTDGVVTAVAAGTATITATATNGTADTSDDKSATCTVTVAPTYKIVMKKGTADSASWAATPNPAEEGKTVTLKYDGVMKVKSVKAVKKAALSLTSLAESTQGMIVGSDGNAYDVSDKDNLPSGVTAVAMVAYKSETAGESLAIALADEGYMNWSTAVATCEAKTEVKGGSWRLPSMDDWKNMTVGNDTDGYNYINLNTALTTAGGSKLNDDGYNSSFYWTSTEKGGNAYQAYFYGDAQDMSFTDYAKTDSGSVRPVLAF